MQTVRRLYVYLVAAVALMISVIGVINLVEIVLNSLWTALGGAGWIQGDADWERRQLSLYLPFVVIAAPIWLVHWWLAERSRHGDEGESERRSPVRTLYLTAGLAAPAAVFLINLIDLLRMTVERLLGATLPAHEREAVPQLLATLVAVGAVWVYHWRVRERDMRDGGLTGATVWLPRLYLYAAAAAGIVFASVGLSNLIELVIDVWLDAGTAVVVTGSWWERPLAEGVAVTVSGVLFWATHWTYATRLSTGDAWWSLSEQTSNLRRFFLLAVLVFTGVMTITGISSGLESAVRQVLGIPEAGDTAGQIRNVAAPMAATAPYILFWVYHQQRLILEGSQFQGAAGLASMRRLTGYTLAAVGLAFAGVGLAELASILVELPGDGGGTVVQDTGWWREQLAWPVGLTLAGGAVWLWHWYAILKRMVTDPDAEQRSTIRRAYLYLILGVSLVALTISLTVTAYRVLEEALGVGGAETLTSEISRPLGIGIVTVAFAAYHGTLLRRDLAVRPAFAPEREAAPARLTVVITGPAGSDLESVAAGLRDQLPEGYDLTFGEDGDGPLRRAPETPLD